MSDVNLLNVWPVTDDERRELDECAEAAPLAEHAIADALQEYPPDLTAAIFARAAIDDDDLTKVDLAWLYSHALVGHVDVRAQLEEAHEAFNASEAKRLEHEQTIADLRAQLETARAEVEHLKFERGEALAWSPWNDHDVLFEKWAQRRAEGGAPPERECVPTQDAYERACAALWKHRGRADALAAAISEVATVAEQVGYSVPETAHVKSALLGVATKLRDALRVDQAALRDLPHPDRAPGGPVSSGQTVTIGPAELPPLPKRVKGTHGPTPEATR